MSKALLKPLWHWYTKLAMDHPRVALPMPNRLAAAGRVWCHPAFFRSAWDRDDDGLLKMLAVLLNSDQVFFDVGANVGLTAILASRRVGPLGKVVAFEPAQANLLMLRYHLRWNDLKNALIEPVCVGASNGEVQFSLLEEGASASNSITFSRKVAPPFVEDKRRRDIVMPIISLDSYWKQSGLQPDVIKIDVEGAELDVLKGAVELLRVCRPVLLIGVHPFWWPDEQSPTALTEFLTTHSYRVETLQGYESKPEHYADFVCYPCSQVR